MYQITSLQVEQFILTIMIKDKVRTDLEIKLMFLEPNEIPVFHELSKKYGYNEAFNMILNGYKPQAFSNIMNAKVRP